MILCLDRVGPLDDDSVFRFIAHECFLAQNVGEALRGENEARFLGERRMFSSNCSRCARKFSSWSSTSNLSYFARSTILSALSIYLTMSNCMVFASLTSLVSSARKSSTRMSDTIFTTKSRVCTTIRFSKAAIRLEISSGPGNVYSVLLVMIYYF